MNFNLSTVVSKFPSLTSAKMFVGKNKGPILICGGLLLGAGAVVSAYRAGMHIDALLDHSKADLDLAKEELDKAKGTEKEFEAKKIVRKVYFKAGKDFIKLHSGVIIFSAASAACILGGNHYFLKQAAASAATYKLLADKFNHYRANVTEEYGEEADKMAFNDLKKDTVIVKKENGEEESIEKLVKKEDAAHNSMSRLFDCGSKHWSRNITMNLDTLRNLERMAQDALTLRGHLFLNEVYDLLDIPRTPIGSLVGWIKDGPISHGHVSFGIFDNVEDPQIRDFLNGREEAVWLDFNVDGKIYDLI